jgi:hypothetical protein
MSSPHSHTKHYCFSSSTSRRHRRTPSYATTRRRTPPLAAARCRMPPQRRRLPLHAAACRRTPPHATARRPTPPHAATRRRHTRIVWYYNSSSDNQPRQPAVSHRFVQQQQDLLTINLSYALSHDKESCYQSTKRCQRCPP